MKRIVTKPYRNKTIPFPVALELEHNARSRADIFESWVFQIERNASALKNLRALETKTPEEAKEKAQACKAAFTGLKTGLHNLQLFLIINGVVEPPYPKPKLSKAQLLQIQKNCTSFSLDDVIDNLTRKHNTDENLILNNLEKCVGNLNAQCRKAELDFPPNAKDSLLVQLRKELKETQKVLSLTIHLIYERSVHFNKINQPRALKARAEKAKLEEERIARKNHRFGQFAHPIKQAA